MRANSDTRHLLTKTLQELPVPSSQLRGACHGGDGEAFPRLLRLSEKRGLDQLIVGQGDPFGEPVGGRESFISLSANSRKAIHGCDAALSMKMVLHSPDSALTLLRNFFRAG